MFGDKLKRLAEIYCQMSQVLVCHVVYKSDVLITSKFCVVSIFVIVDLQTVHHT